MLTHGDDAHIGSFSSLSKSTPAELLVESPLDYRSPSYRALGSTEDRFNVARASEGREFDLGQGAVLRILFPPVGFEKGLADNQAMVAQIEHHGRRLLFTSDAGFATEKWLLKNCRYLPSDVLVCGRHLSDHSLLSEFVSAVSPQALISSDLVDRSITDLRARGIRVFNQRHSGAVEITIGGNRRIEIETFNGESFSIR
jgi:beta-lactamase superfamily II metal-dependent hydrolase